MNHEERYIQGLLSRIEGATVEQSRWWARDRTLVIRTSKMAEGAQVEVRGREVSIRPHPHRVEVVGTFRGRGWKVAMNAAVRGAIRDTEITYGNNAAA